MQSRPGDLSEGFAHRLRGPHLVPKLRRFLWEELLWRALVPIRLTSRRQEERLRACIRCDDPRPAMGPVGRALHPDLWRAALSRHSLRQERKPSL